VEIYENEVFTVMKEASHHVAFRKQLIAASAPAKTLEEAVSQWRFLCFVIFPKENLTRCQICNTSIVRAVAIRNEANETVLFIGEDCYDKLVHFAQTKRLESTRIRSRVLERKDIRNIFKDAFPRREDRQSFLGWFEAQDGIPETIRTSLQYVRIAKIAPSVEAARELVAYYNANRLMPADAILDYDIRSAAHKLGVVIPARITNS